jgi:hypothetical protein
MVTAYTFDPNFEFNSTRYTHTHWIDEVRYESERSAARPQVVADVGPSNRERREGGCYSLTYCLVNFIKGLWDEQRRVTSGMPAP